MARIRSLHPGYFSSSHVRLRDSDQLLLLALGCQADDQGIFLRDPHRLKINCRPASAETTDDIDLALQRLESAGAIRCFKVSNRVYGAIANFVIHQRAVRPNAVHPCPTSFYEYLGFNPHGQRPKIKGDKAVREAERARTDRPEPRHYPNLDDEIVSDRPLNFSPGNWEGSKTPYQGQNQFQEETRRDDLTATADADSEFE